MQQHQGLRLKKIIELSHLKIKDISELSGIPHSSLYDLYKKPEILRVKIEPILKVLGVDPVLFYSDHKLDIEQSLIPIIKNADLNKEIGIIHERLLRLDGYTTVMFDTVVNLLSQSSTKPAALISAELQEAVAMALKLQANELRQKS
jgi:hypothetical protein